MRARLFLPCLALLAAVFLWPLARPAGGVPADHDPESEYVQRRKPGRCLCDTGKASWRYLRAPMKPPADPPVCGLLRAGGDCGNKERPKGTGAECWGSPRKECFYKRHAWSHRLQCLECFADASCDVCDALIGKPDPKVEQMLAERHAQELGAEKGGLSIVVSPHFYVVTDIDMKLKVRTEGGAPRVISAHELAHLYAERCERAYDDFEYWFGGQVRLGGPTGVYLMAKQGRAENFAARYLGSPRTDMMYGGRPGAVGGFAYNGFVGSLQEQRNDDDLHAYCRHMVGHILFSCWIQVNGQEKYCPKWAFIGAAHFLEKLLEPHKDYATFCSEETTAPSGSGKDWDKKARGLGGRRLEPIQTLFQKHSLGAFAYDDHVQCWSLMDLGLREDRERWLGMLALLRRGEDEGLAIKEHLGLTPDQLRERWRDRVLGARPSLGEIRRDRRDDPDEPGRREREAIRTTQEPEILAGLIRGVHTVADVRLAEVVAAHLDSDSDLVRETVHVVLERTTDPEVLDWLVTEGLSHKAGLVRAGIARSLGAMGHAPARAALEPLLTDGFWLARANAAWALARLGDPGSLPLLVEALGEKQPKAWIAISDAVAAYGTRDARATAHAVERLSHSAWQVRVTACRGLAAYGTPECLDALIERFALEQGRLEKELREALRRVARDDLGPNAETWKRWWQRQKERHGGLDPNAPPPPDSDTEGRYAKPEPSRPGDPHYYGRRIYSRAVGFVFDTSGSMDKTIRIPQGASTQLGDIPTSGTRMEVARQVLAGAIRALHPQTRFSLVFFSTEVRPWKRDLIPASPSNTASAAQAIQNAPAAGETNIHGALKAALGLHDLPTLAASLEAIPDTVYFLTDGSPTRGEITSAPELLGWFAHLNRFAKVRLHVVAFGNLGVDLEFLRRLAEAGDGEFIHVPEE